MYISNSNSYSIISGSNGIDSIYNSGYQSTIYTDAGNDVIENEAESVMIYGDDGNDSIKSRWHTTINAGAGNDTITGGSVIVYLSGDGDDVITDYDGQEIRLVEGTDYRMRTAGNDVLVSLDSGSMRLKNVSEQSINITGGINKDINYIYNSQDDSIINGTDGNDSICNDGRSVTVNAGNGDDTIRNNGIFSEKSLLNGGTGNDLISNDNHDVSINGGVGNDTILASNEYVEVFLYASGDGKDFITNYDKDWILITDGSSFSTTTTENDVSISGSDGTTITNLGIVNIGSTSISLHGNYDDIKILNSQSFIINEDDSVVTGTSERDYIYNDHDSATINADAGNDTIVNNVSAGNVIIHGGAGNDIINNYGDNAEIYGDSGNDFIYSSPYSTNAEWYHTIHGGTGNDTINASNGFSSDIYGDAGNDYIFAGSYSYVNGGKGDDTISGGCYIEYASGDGNDLIKSYNDSYFEFRITDGSEYTTMRSNSDVIVKVGDGSITFENAYGKTININNIVQIGNNTPQSTFNGTSKGDSIYNSGDYSTINGGEGNDSIDNNAQYAMLNGDNGDDTIYSYGSNNTINGGKGNDTITTEGNANVIQYASGDGNDVITDYQTDTTIQITDASNYSATTSGSDVIIKVGASSITLTDAADKTIKLRGGVNTTPGAVNYIENDSANTLVNGTRLNDSIYNSGNDSTIDASTGNDTIENQGRNVIINGGDGNDLIESSDGLYSTINGGTGNDTITGSDYPDVFIYKAGDGSDIIIGYNDSDSIRITDGSDYSTERAGDDVLISIGNGSILLEDAADIDVNIIGGNFIGNDDTTVEDDTTTVEDDTTTVEDDTTTVEDDTTTTGDDTTTVEDDTTTVEDDTTTVEDDTTTVEDDTTTSAPAIDKTIENSKSNTTISGGFGNDTIINTGGSNVIIRAGAGNDYIYNNTGSNIAINGGAGNDTIENDFAEYISISGDAGDDSINGTDNYATIDGGDGADTIVGNHFRSMVKGGDGDDIISLSSYWYNTIDGGAGNDIISLTGSNNLIAYAAGDGDDTVYGFGDNDTLTITGGSHGTPQTIGNNVFINLEDGGRIILNGAKGKSININNENNSVDTVQTSDNSTPQDVIKTFMKSLDDSTEPVMINMLNNAIKDASGGKYTDIQDVINDMVADCQKYNNADPINGWRRFLLEKCDIDLDNADTGAISGYDAGGSDEAKTNENILSEDIKLDSSFTDNYFNIGNMNVYLTKQTSNNTIERTDYNSLQTEEKKTWQGLKSGWLQNALNLNEKSFGSNFSLGSKSSSTLEENNIYVLFKNVKNDPVASVNQGKTNSKGQTLGPFTMTVNTYYFPLFKSGNANDAYMMDNIEDDNYIGNSYYFERILAHEFTHMVMDANINNATGFEGLPQFIKEGMAELTHGCDDNPNRKENISTYAGNPDSLKEALDLKPYRNNGAYEGGYMFLRYIAKQFSSKGGTDNYDVAIQSPSDAYIEPPEGMKIGNSLLSVSSAFDDSMIVLSDYGADINKANALALTDDVAILGGTNNDSLNSGSGDDKLYGGDGNDTLIGNRGDDTLTGGSGADLFVYENGDDVIVDYAEGVDKIQLKNCSIANSTLGGDDVIINTDVGTLIVKDGRDQLITVIDRDGNETSKIYGKNILTPDNVGDFDGVTLKSSKLILEAPFTGSVDLADFSSKLKTVDATKTDGTVELIGNDNKNTFKAGSGGSTLDGAGGKDKLYGGSGSDVFIFDGQGKDKIYNYSADDRIEFTADITKAKLSGKNLKVTVEGGGVLTVNKILDTEMTITTADGQTNNYIFDKKHKDLDAALENANSQLPADQYWFIDDNPINDELSTIVETDNAIGQLAFDETVQLLKHSARIDNTLSTSTSARHKR